MSLGFRRALAALALIAAAGCGSRSQLLGSESAGEGGGGAGGGGGTPTTTGEGGTTSSTTTTGGGGFTVSTTTTTTTITGTGPCAALEYQTPFASLVGGMKPHQRDPKLAFSADDKTRVTVATAWQFVETPNPPLELRRTSFEPWPEFPAGSGLGNTNKMDLDGGASFAIATSAGDRFALLFADFQEPPAGGLRFSADFDPDQPNPPDTFLVDPVAQETLFLTRGSSYFLWAGTFESGGYYELRSGAIDEDISLNQVVLGCAEGRMLADAVPYGDAFLAAFTDGNPAGCNNALPGPATSIQALRMNETGFLETMIEVTTTETTDLRLAARSDGAWIVWTDKGGEDLPPSLQIGRLTPDASYEYVNYLYANYEPGSVAAASFEDYLVVAWIEPEPEGASPRVQVFLPDGTPAGGVKVQATAKAIPPLALLGSPFDRQAVLAWSEELGDPQLGDQLRITRVDCLDN